MYRTFIRPILFLFPPESVHKFVIRSIRLFFRIPGISALVGNVYTLRKPELEREVFGLKFMNPVGLAAGFDKDAEIFNEFASFGFSFIEAGTITPKAQPGNKKPRSFRLRADKALINRMGFNNSGAEEAAKKLGSRKTNVIVGGNIGKNTVTENKDAADDYARCFEALYDCVDYFTINISCPNINSLSELQDKEMLAVIASKITGIRKRMSVYRPVLVKISPDLTEDQIDDVLDIIREYDLDGIIATNTSIGRKNLLTDKLITDRIGKGGLSGRPIRDRSDEVIAYISNRTGGSLPIIGVGGIMTPGDAVRKLEAGASLVQIYTGMIYRGPGLVKRINRKILEVQHKTVTAEASAKSVIQHAE